jgi:NAD(P)-dependent dehydrogenase (short-subunit alcohol dehydrogenase family)
MQTLEGTEFAGQTVVISGGSKGLGLALAEEFGKQGANVVIFARHGDEVDEAVMRLRGEGLRVEGHVCDVGSEEQVTGLLAAVTERHGPVDVLVNNAGVIQVGPLDTMTTDDFKQALDIMLWGVVHPSLAVLPAMKARGYGRIVNITSIGGKVSVPHLLPYNTAKFAAVGFSEGLRGELATAGVKDVKVVTVVPGLMRTGSFLNAMFRGETRREFTWFSLASSAPLLSIPADKAARRIVKATKRGEAELILSMPANAIARMQGLFPGTTLRMMSLGRFILPKSTGTQGSRSGADTARTVRSKTFDSAMTLGRRGAERFQPHHTSEAINR